MIEENIIAKPEEVVIIGGGLTGCLSALFAARVKNADGTPKYHVKLLEANSQLFNGTSELAARLHLGGEYPADFKTAVDCLNGAALWKLLFPEKGIFTKQNPMRFLIATATEQNPSEKIKLQYYIDQYEKVRGEYGALVDKIFKDLKTNPELAGVAGKLRIGSVKSPLQRSDVTKALFGPLKNFYEILSPKELEHYDKKTDVSHVYPGKLNPLQQAFMFEHRVAGGIQTREPGLNIPSYLSAIEDAMQQAGVTVIPNARAEKIDEKPGAQGYSIHCKDGRVFESDQLIQAAWEGGFALDGPHRNPGQHKKVRIYRRAMALVDTHAIPKDQLPPPSFVLKDGAGGMFSSISPDLALVYHPLVAHLGEVELDSADPEKRSIPEAWRKPLSEAEKNKLMTEYKAALVKGPFPFLENGAKFYDIQVRTTLNFQDDIDKRRHEPTEEIKPGYHALYATKLTLAPQSAIEAVEQLKMRSHMKAEHQTGKLGEIPKALDVALRDETYQLKEVLKPSVGLLQAFIEKRPHWPFNVYEGFKERYASTPYLPPITSAEESQNPSQVKDLNLDLNFGHNHIAIYTQHGPKTGFLFDKDEHKNTEICDAIKKWATSKDPRLITEIVPAELLAPAFYNRLMHADTPELHNMIEAFTNIRPDNAHIPPDIEKILWKAKTNLPGNITKDFAASTRMSAGRGLGPRIDPIGEFLAAWLPAIFGVLTKEERIKVTQAFAQSLHDVGKDKLFLAPLGNPDINILHITEEKNFPLPATKIVNTGEAISIDLQTPRNPQAVPFEIEFQGEKFYPVEFNLHPVFVTNMPPAKAVHGRHSDAVVQQQSDNAGSGKHYAFKLYSNPLHEKESKETKADLNDESVGELRAIFMNKNRDTAQRSSLVLAAHVKIGPKNEALEPYIQLIRRHLNETKRPLNPHEEISCSGISFNPLNCFNGTSINPFRNKDQSLPLAPFSSLETGNIARNERGQIVLKEDANDMYYRGVYVVHTYPFQPVTVSPEQWDVLQKALPPENIKINEKGVILPITRAVPTTAEIAKSEEPGPSTPPRR